MTSSSRFLSWFSTILTRGWNRPLPHLSNFSSRPGLDCCSRNFYRERGWDYWCLQSFILSWYCGIHLCRIFRFDECWRYPQFYLMDGRLQTAPHYIVYSSLELMSMSQPSSMWMEARADMNKIRCFFCGLPLEDVNPWHMVMIDNTTHRVGCQYQVRRSNSDILTKSRVKEYLSLPTTHGMESRMLSSQQSAR